VPDVRFRATVSSGTYLRSLARDIGAALGCGAHLATLRRTHVGPFALADAVAPTAVTAAMLLEPAALVANLPRRELTAEERDAVVHGRPIHLVPGTRYPEAVGLFGDGHLVAVAEAVGDVLKPRLVVVDA